MSTPRPGRRDTKAALSALFPRVQGQREIPGLLLLHRSRIVLKPQVRADVSSGIGELRENIASLHARRLGIEGSGILQPLLVAPDWEQAEMFRLIAGERRFRASQGIVEEVPVMVVNADETAIPILQLIENLQRRDLPPLDEARGLQQLMDNENLSIRAAALLIGKPKSYLSDRLALLKMAPDIQEMLSQRSDTLLHAREIHALSNPQQRRALIEEITQNALSLGELKRRIADITPATTASHTTNSGTKSRKTSPSQSPDNRQNDDDFARNALESLLQNATQTRQHLQNTTLNFAQKQQMQAQIKGIEEELAAIKALLKAD